MGEMGAGKSGTALDRRKEEEGLRLTQRTGDNVCGSKVFACFCTTHNIQTMF